MVVFLSDETVSTLVMTHTHTLTLILVHWSVAIFRSPSISWKTLRWRTHVCCIEQWSKRHLRIVQQSKQDYDSPLPLFYVMPQVERESGRSVVVVAVAVFLFLYLWAKENFETFPPFAKKENEALLPSAAFNATYSTRSIVVVSHSRKAIEIEPQVEIWALSFFILFSSFFVLGFKSRLHPAYSLFSLFFLTLLTRWTFALSSAP